MLCAQFSLVKHVDGGEEVLPIPCKSWSCEYCQPLRRAALIALAGSGAPNRLLTLTVNPTLGANPLERRKLLHDAWKKLTKRIMRKHGWKQLHYMAFVEKTQKGEPHLHILLRCGFIAQRWLSAQMKDLIGAPIVDIRKVNSVKAACYYVSKYVTKAPAQFGTLKRYWVSRRWAVDEKPATDETERKPEYDELRRGSYEHTLQDRISTGWTVETLVTGWVRFWRPGWRPWVFADP